MKITINAVALCRALTSARTDVKLGKRFVSFARHEKPGRAKKLREGTGHGRKTRSRLEVKGREGVKVNSVMKGSEKYKAGHIVPDEYVAYTRND